MDVKTSRFFSGSRTYFDILKMLLFIGVTSLVIFASARNSLTWHLQKFWGTSGDFWEALWGKVLHAFGNDEFAVSVYGSVIFWFVFFWTVNAFFMIVDLTGWPSFVLSYKIQPKEKVKMPDFWKAFRVANFNLVVIGAMVMIVSYKLMKWRGCPFGSELPTFHYVLGEFVIFALVEELGFYYSHRLAHHPKLYKYIHKMHHEWTAPIGIVCIYAHPIEHVISNLSPLIAGPLITGAHLATAWLWLAVAIASTTISHSGYHMPFLPSPEAHDFHHLKFTNCFGTLGILDRLHGTDSLFLKSKQSQRHNLYFTLTPPRVLVPDEENVKRNNTSEFTEAVKTD